MNHETVNHDGTHPDVPNVIEQNVGLQSPTQRSQKQHAEINDEQGRSRPFKTIQFESIWEPDQNRCEIPDKMAKYASKYMEIFTPDQNWKDSILPENPGPSNLKRPK